MMNMKKSASNSKERKTTTKPKYKHIDGEQLSCAFKMFDANHDGKLTIDEMKRMLNKLGIIDVTEKMIEKIAKDVSKNDSGLINEPDFLHWFSRFKTPKDDDVEADLRAAFLVFDRDKNGFITRDELKQAMLLMGESVTDRDLDELLRTTDHDRDGRINYDEFIKTLL